MRDEATNALRDEEEDAEGRRLAPDAQYFLVREQEKNEKRKFSMQIFFGERERERSSWTNGSKWKGQDGRIQICIPTKHCICTILMFGIRGIELNIKVAFTLG